MGSSSERIKVADPTTGEVTSTALVEGEVVNEQEVRAQAEAEWRAQYGALTPNLAHRIAQMSPEDTLYVSVVFSDIQSLPKRDQNPSTTYDFQSPPLSTDGTNTEALFDKVLVNQDKEDELSR